MNPGSCGGGQSCGGDHPGQGHGGPHAAPEFDGSAGVAAIFMLGMIGVVVYKRFARSLAAA